MANKQASTFGYYDSGRSRRRSARRGAKAREARDARRGAKKEAGGMAKIESGGEDEEA